MRRYMMQLLLRAVFGSQYERNLKKMHPIVAQINELEPTISKLSKAELQAKTESFKERIRNGESLDSILPEAFACVRHAAQQTIGLRHYDVQLMGGIALNWGTISEMRTGEGKTLTSTLAVYLNSLACKGVHVVTVNDYLARRDAEWMRPVYEYLGVSVGFILSQMSHEERQEGYAADITYGTNNEFGFDYLRDNMVDNKSFKVQRGHFFAIVDEVDSILIDEARTPLIISGPADTHPELYTRVNKVVIQLKNKEDYEIDEKARSVLLTEIGIEKVEKLLSIDNLYAPDNIELVHHVQQSLRAHTLFAKDVDYVIQNGEVLIVDEFTGRLMIGRRYSDGLHQALEAKEKVDIKKENQTLATITFQNYFRMYSKLAGMTGTADTEAEEFKKIYNLSVTVLPTHHPMIRKDYPDKIYRTFKEKLKAIAEDVKEHYLTGQPVLVGTVSIENSEKLSALLKNISIPHSVLNAKFHDQEAEIVKNAGQKGKVTIATNMAGRGTDIVLGEGVRELGGLYIIGSERHESRRIDNQLRGRAGRQGDPGKSRFYLSLEDDLMRIFGSDKISPIMQRLGMEEGEAIEHKMVSNAIERSQKRVESHNFDIRKHLLEYDDVMNKQRRYIYHIRNEILEKDDISHLMQDFIHEAVEIQTNIHCPSKNYNEWDLENYCLWLETTFKSEYTPDDLKDIRLNDLLDKIQTLAIEKYTSKKNLFDKEIVSSLERMISLQVIDQKWKEHLYDIDQLREGIWTLGYAERNPLIEYRFKSFNLFEECINAIKLDITDFFFKAHIEVDYKPQSFDNQNDYVEKGTPIHKDIQTYGVGSLLPLKDILSINTEDNMAPVKKITNQATATPPKSSGGSSQRKSSRRK